MQTRQSKFRGFGDLIFYYNLKLGQGLLFSFFWKNCRIIKKTSAALEPPGNPYRVILRRDYPEPLIALLAFILGIWLWDHYFGKTEGYVPGTEEIAMVKIDRDLRLADAMEEDPKWLKWLVGVDKPAGDPSGRPGGFSENWRLRNRSARKVWRHLRL